MLQEQSAAEILFNPHHKHADFIFDMPWQDTVITAVAKMVTGQHLAGHHSRSDSASSYELMQQQKARGGNSGKSS